MSAATAAADRPSNAPEACVGPASAEAGKASACDGCPNQSACASGEGRKVDPAVAEVQQRLAEVKHKILVLSGKGGVGQCGRRAALLITIAVHSRRPWRQWPGEDDRVLMVLFLHLVC